MGSLKQLFAGMGGGRASLNAEGQPATMFDDITLPQAPAPGPEPTSLAQKFGNAYRSIEQAPAVAANYYSPGGEQVLSEGLTPNPPSISQLVESGGITPDEAASDTYAGAITRKLGGVAAELGSSPTNAALLLGTAGLGNLGRAGQIAQRGISLGFAGQMIPAAAEKLAQAEALREQEGFTPRVAGQFAGGGLEAGFAGLAGAHGVSPIEAPATLAEKFAPQQEAIIPHPDAVPVPAPGRSIIQRPSFLDQVDRTAVPMDSGPALGYGRGGVPVEAPLPAEAAPVPVQAAAPEVAPVGEQTAQVAPEPIVAPKPASYADVLASLPPEQRAAVENEVHSAKTTDPLTGLKNKYGWNELTQAINPDTDHVAVIDLKGFKAVNDKFGHSAGDEVLTRVGGLIRKHFGDETARDGGDEFGAVLRDHTYDQAAAKVSAFNDDIKSMTHTLEGPNGERIDIPAVEAHIGLAGGVDAARRADLAANAHRVQQGSGRRATDIPGDVPDLNRPVEGTPALPEPRVQDRAEQLAPAAEPLAGPERDQNFKRWFGDSKVVDANGEPQRVFHGTNNIDAAPESGISVFNPESHFGTAEQANTRVGRWAGIHAEGDSVYPTYLNIRNPKRVSDIYNSREAWSEAIAKAKAEGHDGLVYSNDAEGGGDSYVTFSPEQVKSATGNRGTFDATNPDIRFGTSEPSSPVPADLRPRIEQVFKGLPIEEQPNGYTLKAPSGKRILIKPTGDIAFDAEALAKGHGKASLEKVSSGEQMLAGATFNLGRDALVHIADHGVLPHESVHVFLDHFASPEESATLQRRFSKQADVEGRAWDEVAADAYNKWFDRPKEVQQSLATRVFQRIKDFVSKVSEVFRPTEQGVFRKIESGEAFQRSANEAVPRGVEQPKFATATKPIRPIPDRNAVTPEAGERKPPKLPINLEHLDLPEELKSKWADDLAKNKDYYAQLKGHVTGEDVVQASRDLGLSRDQIAGVLKGKRPPTKEEFFAARDLLVSERKGLDVAEKALTKAEAGGADTTLAKTALAKQAASYDALLNNFMGKQAEAARTLAFFKLMAHGDIDVSGEGRQIQEAVKRITNRTGSLADEMAAKVRDAIRSGDAQRITSTIQDAMKAPLKDKIFEAWINGLLSSPSTSITKGVSDIANLLVKGGERGLASQLDALNERWTGSPRQRFAGEMSAHFDGMRSAIPEAMQSFRDAWAEKPVGVLGEGDVVEHALRGPAIPGKFGKVVRAGYGGGGSRALKAIDAFSKTLARASEKHVQALRIANEEAGPGASVGDISKRASEIANTPDEQLTKLLGKDKGQAVLDSMTKFQKNATFTDDFGKAMTAAQQFRKDVPLARWILPFMKVPWNIARNVYQHTPLNFINIVRKIKTGELKGAAITDELVKPLVGTPLMMAVALKAASGEITGNGPDDARKRAAWLASGMQPYSIKTPAGWISYKKIEPWAGVIGLAADTVEASKEQDAQDKITHAIAGLQEAFEKKSFLTGLENIGGLLKDPLQYTKSYAQQMEGTVVPAVFSRAAQAIDPTLRQVNGPGVDPLLARIPFASETLQPKLGPAGEELQRGGSAVERFASPFTRTEEKQGPIGDVERVLAQVGYSPGKAPQQLALRGQKVPLTPDEQAVYGRADALAAQRISSIVNSQQFQNLPDTEQEGGEQSKEAILRRIYTKARTQARDSIVATSDFGRRFRAAAQDSRQPHA